MKITLKKEREYIIPYSEQDVEKLKKLKDGIYVVDIKNTDTRTLKQNRALHKYFSMLADVLNGAGLPIAKVIKVDIEWSDESVKELLWRPIQRALVKKHSTTQLDKKELDEVYLVLNRALGERFGIHIPFPSVDIR